MSKKGFIIGGIAAVIASGFIPYKLDKKENGDFLCKSLFLGIRRTTAEDGSRKTRLTLPGFILADKLEETSEKEPIAEFDLPDFKKKAEEEFDLGELDEDEINDALGIQ